MAMTDIRDQIEFAVRKVAARKAAEREIAEALKKLKAEEAKRKREGERGA